MEICLLNTITLEKSEQGSTKLAIISLFFKRTTMDKNITDNIFSSTKYIGKPPYNSHPGHYSL